LFDGFTIKLNLKYKTKKKAKLFTTQNNIKSRQFKVKIWLRLSLGGQPAKYGKKRKNNLLNLSGLKKINKD
tara:strand:+ start:50 stop:262 length:213 start_codon:yes stop_codon:yes gene_type:complete